LSVITRSFQQTSADITKNIYLIKKPMCSIVNY